MWNSQGGLSQRAAIAGFVSRVTKWAAPKRARPIKPQTPDQLFWANRCLDTAGVFLAEQAKVDVFDLTVAFQPLVFVSAAIWLSMPSRENLIGFSLPTSMELCARRVQPERTAVLLGAGAAYVLAPKNACVAAMGPDITSPLAPLTGTGAAAVLAAAGALTTAGFAVSVAAAAASVLGGSAGLAAGALATAAALTDTAFTASAAAASPVAEALGLFQGRIALALASADGLAGAAAALAGGAAGTAAGVVTGLMIEPAAAFFRASVVASATLGAGAAVCATAAFANNAVTVKPEAANAGSNFDRRIVRSLKTNGLKPAKCPPSSP
jgi:hypothetical protein